MSPPLDSLPWHHWYKKAPPIYSLERFSFTPLKNASIHLHSRQNSSFFVNLFCLREHAEHQRLRLWVWGRRVNKQPKKKIFTLIVDTHHGCCRLLRMFLSSGPSLERHNMLIFSPQIEAVLGAIGSCLMAIVNGIGAIITAIVSGVVTVFDVIISCLTCGHARRRRHRMTRSAV